VDRRSDLIRGRVIAVTGGGSGIGRATCEVAALEGALIVVADLDEQAADLTVSSIRAGGGKAVACYGDTSTLEGARRLLTTARDTFGGIDGLVCAGMRRVYSRAEDFDDEDWTMVVEQGLTGYFRCAQEAGRAMLEQGRGSIVFVTSIAGNRPTSGGAAYVSVKATEAALARQLGWEWADRGVRVNAVAPGLTLTEGARRTTAPDVMARLEIGVGQGNVARPEQVAEVCVFLLSDRASHVNCEEVTVDGGARSS
jgi:NAD(P)-dependent dehydrogenase (short-subunit alcohol dehydrogenase family)